MTRTVTTEPGAPDGFWVRNDHHVGPLPPLQWGIWVEPMGVGFRAGMARYGLPVLGFTTAMVDGWVYLSFAPLADPAEIGRRIETGLALPADAEARAARRWLDDDLPRWTARRRTLADELEGDDAAVAATTTAIAAGLAELVEARFSDIVVGGLIADWSLRAAEVLGWDPGTAVAWLRGHAPATTALARAVAEVGRGASIDDVVAEHGDLVLGTDVLEPTVGERPDLISRLARQRTVGADAGPSTAGDPDLGGVEPGDRARLTASLEGARLGQRWREATSDELSCWLGLLRRAGLTAGQRLVAAERLARADDALFLTAAELATALTGEPIDAATLIAERRAAHARAAAAAPPATLGTPPSGPPALAPGNAPPPSVAAAMARLEFVGRHLGAPPGPPVAGPAGITGVAAAPGVVEGQARVVLDIEELDGVEAGDILVCRTTSPAWNAVLALAGAVVCDGGGFLSHPALMAREFGIPAVVGTKVATASIRTGDRVVVDGDRGTIERR